LFQAGYLSDFQKTIGDAVWQIQHQFIVNPPPVPLAVALKSVNIFPNY
jgi:hypothetical protein